MRNKLYAAVIIIIIVCIGLSVYDSCNTRRDSLNASRQLITKQYNDSVEKANKAYRITYLSNEIILLEMDSSLYQFKIKIIKSELEIMRINGKRFFECYDTYYTQESAIDSLNSFTNKIKSVSKNLEKLREELAQLNLE